MILRQGSRILIRKKDDKMDRGYRIEAARAFLDAMECHDEECAKLFIEAMIKATTAENIAALEKS